MIRPNVVYQIAKDWSSRLLSCGCNVMHVDLTLSCTMSFVAEGLKIYNSYLWEIQNRNRSLPTHDKHTAAAAVAVVAHDARS